MPYDVGKGHGCPASKPWACFNTETGAVMGCHETKDDAEAQMAALYANEPEASSMSHIDELRAAAAEARKAAVRASGEAQMRTPAGRPERQPVRAPSQLRASKVERDGLEWYLVEGYASVYERGYEMWDMFGPYTEIVSAGAGSESLKADPEVVFRFNHGGTPMAGTKNGRLELWDDETGLGDRAWLNPKRADVETLIRAMEDQDVTEQSFMFMITAGQWSPDYLEYRINGFDLDRGDVGPVTYGANPYTSVTARAQDFLADIPSLPALMAREAYERLSQRSDLLVPARAAQRDSEPAGRSIAMLRTQLLVQGDED